MFKEYDLIITTNNIKKDIIKNKKNNNKIYTLNEFYKKLYFDFNEETIFYVMNKYNVISDIAKIYLDNLMFINDIDYKSSKLSFLSSIKKDLYENKIIKDNKMFKEYLKNKRILFLNIPLTKDIEYTKEYLKESKIDLINNQKESYINKIYEFKTLEEEVVFVATKICELIINGADINNIYITNIDEEYRKTIKRIFPMFNIPVSLKSNTSIFGTFLATKFFELYDDDITKTIDTLNNYIDTENAKDIYNSIINIVNKYTFIDDYTNVKELIKNDMKNTIISRGELLNSVHEVSLKDTLFTENDYVFTLSLNQGIIPTIYKDEQFLTDNDIKELPLPLTVEKNIIEKEITINKIKSIKNHIITYKLYSSGQEFIPSSIIENLEYEVINNYDVSKTYSNIYNKIRLCSLKDEFYKYGTKTNELLLLDNTYKEIPYNTYDNKFTGINKKDLQSFINNKLYLSYSSIDKYFKCPFSYYVNSILKVDIYEETFYQVIGTIFHEVLEKMNDDTFDNLWNNAINNIEYVFNACELFFLKKLKSELLFVIETIKEQEYFTDLKDELHEEKIITSISGDIEITFTGIIDKIKYKEHDDHTVIAIIDYKTGNPNIDLSGLSYGIDMQLPIYLYLAKNTNKLKNIKVAGFYLQKILNNESSVDNSTNYEQLRKKNLLLQGYSNGDVSILEQFDNSYMDSNLIKSMKTKNDGSFYSYSEEKLLTNKEIDKITNIVENNITNGASKIINGEFPISPKRINKINKGCNFCKYKDICYMTPKDIEDLEPKTKDEILGGDTIGMD